MNAREHFAEAERLLEAAKEDVRSVDSANAVGYARAMDRASVAIAAAGVHAKLSEAHAIAERLDDLDQQVRDLQWAKADT